jgi:hypothetical protein
MMSENSLCTRPPALSEEELYFALDEVAEETTLEHLAACAYCRSQLEKLEAFDEELIAPLYRFNCPSPSEVSQYHLNLFLDEPSRARIALHLEKCSLCQTELVTLENFLSKEAEAEQDEKTLYPDFQSSFAKPKTILFPSPVLAPQRAVRGSESGAILAKAGTTSIRIQLKQSDDEENRLSLQLSSSDVNWKEAMVILFQEEAVKSVQTMPKNLICEFTLSSLSPISLHIIAEDKTFIEFKDIAVET